MGIEGNELADAWAKRAVETYTDETQAEVNVSLAAFKAYMRQKITKNIMKERNNDTHQTQEEED